MRPEARRDVQEQHAPEHPPLGPFHGLVEGEGVGSGHRGRRGRPARGGPALGGVLVELCASRDDDQEDHAPDVEGLGHAHVIDHPGGDLAHEEGAGAEAHDGQTRDEAALVGEPADQRRDGRHVTEAVAEAADDAEAEIKQEKTPDLIGIAGKQNTGTEEDTADGGHEAGALLVDEGPAEGGRNTDDGHQDHHGGRHLEIAPPVGLHQGDFEDGPCIDRPQTELHDDGSPCNQPTFAFQIFIAHKIIPPPLFICFSLIKKWAKSPL